MTYDWKNKDDAEQYRDFIARSLHAVRAGLSQFPRNNSELDTLREQALTSEAVRVGGINLQYC